MFLFALHLLLTRQSVIMEIYKVASVRMVCELCSSSHEQKCRVQLRIYGWEWNVYVYEEKQQTSYGTLRNSGFYSAPVKSVLGFVFIYS